MNWKDAPVTKIICHCEKVTKKKIIVAINQGARSLDGIREATGACAHCREQDPSCMDCRAEVAEMLAYYAPLADALKPRQ